MATTPQASCARCGGATAPGWRVCPFCGAALLASPDLSQNKAVDAPLYIGPEEEARGDLRLIGIGLIVLGAFGAAAGIALLLNGDITRFDSLDGLLTTILIVGGCLISLVVLGTVVAAAGGRGRDPGATAATSLLGGLAAGLMACLLAVVVAVAMCIYVVASCFDACGVQAASGRAQPTPWQDGNHR